MALPRLNDKPKYDLVIPSTGQKVRFRPYLVKEEKVLMMAIESKDQAQALNAVVDTLEACIEDSIDKSVLKVFDIEYMFLMIRSKSVGETSTVTVKCKDCEAENELVIPLSDIPVPKARHDGWIRIESDITLKMGYPVWTDMLNMQDEGKSETEQTFAMISACCNVLESGEERFDLKDEPLSEIENFIDSLSSPQFEKIKDFVQNMPRLEKDVSFACQGCAAKNEMMLRGLDDFF